MAYKIYKVIVSTATELYRRFLIPKAEFQANYRFLINFSVSSNPFLPSCHHDDGMLYRMDVVGELDTNR